MAAIGRLSGKYSELRKSATAVPPENAEMHQTGLLYSMALGLEQDAMESWGRFLVYGNVEPSKSRSLWFAASGIYANAEKRVSDILREDNAATFTSSQIAALSLPVGDGF